MVVIFGKDLDSEMSMLLLGSTHLDFQILYNKEQFRLFIIKSLLSRPLSWNRALVSLLFLEHIRDLGGL